MFAWKTWKCQGTWQLSGTCRGNWPNVWEISCQGKLFIGKFTFWPVLVFHYYSSIVHVCYTVKNDVGSCHLGRRLECLEWGKCEAISQCLGSVHSLYHIHWEFGCWTDIAGWCLLQFAYMTAFKMKAFIIWCLTCEYVQLLMQPFQLHLWHILYSIHGIHLYHLGWCLNTKIVEFSYLVKIFFCICQSCGPFEAKRSTVMVITMLRWKMLHN